MSFVKTGANMVEIGTMDGLLCAEENGAILRHYLQNCGIETIFSTAITCNNEIQTQNTNTKSVSNLEGQLS